MCTLSQIVFCLPWCVGGKDVTRFDIFLGLRAPMEALKTKAHKSSLTDLHIACQQTASRDSGTDASQANAAFTAGSVAKQLGACSRSSLTSEGCIISCCNTVTNVILSCYIHLNWSVFRVVVCVECVFWPFWSRSASCTYCGCPGCACCRINRRHFEKVNEGKTGTQLLGIQHRLPNCLVWSMLTIMLWSAFHSMTGQPLLTLSSWTNPNRRR